MVNRFAADIFKTPNFMQERENYQDHAVVGLENRANETAQAFASDAQVQGYGLAAAATVGSAAHEAEAILAASQAQGQAAQVGAAWNAVEGIGSAMGENLRLGKGLFGGA